MLVGGQIAFYPKLSFTVDFVLSVQNGLTVSCCVSCPLQEKEQARQEVLTFMVELTVS